MEQRSELIQPSIWWEKLPRPIYKTLERASISLEWFEIYKLTEDTFAIYEPYHFEEDKGIRRYYFKGFDISIGNALLSLPANHSPDK